MLHCAMLGRSGITFPDSNPVPVPVPLRLSCEQSHSDAAPPHRDEQAALVAQRLQPAELRQPLLGMPVIAGIGEQAVFFVRQQCAGIGTDILDVILGEFDDLYARVSAPSEWSSVLDQLCFVLPKYAERASAAEKKAIATLTAHLARYTGH